METMPFTEDRNSVFARLEQIAARANLSKEDREIYEEQWRNYNDYYNVLDYATEQSEKKGREEGRAEGRAEGLLEVAIAMKNSGSSIDYIVKCTKLSREEVEKL